MQGMRRALRSVAAVAAGLALAAMVPTCPCPGTAVPAAGGHACCAPPFGVSATDPGCCGGHDVSPSALLAAGPLPAAAPAGLAVVVRAASLQLPAPSPHRRVPASPSPPPAVLRI